MPRGNAQLGQVLDKAAAVSAAADPYGEIVALARESASKHRFLGGVLRSVATHFDAPYAALHVRYTSDVVQEECHRGPTDPKFWKPSLQQFLTDSLTEPKLRAKLLKAKSGTAKIAFLSAPLFDPSGPAIGALALVVTLGDETSAEAHLVRLESLARLASFAAEFVGVRCESAAVGMSASPRFRPAACATAEELAFTLTNELRNKLGCEQVALGLVRGRAVGILSVSGLDEVQTKSPGIVVLRSAMEECLDAEVPIVCQREEAWSQDGLRSGYRLHKQWHTAARGDATASLPLCVRGRTVAVLSLRRNAQKPFSREELEKIRGQVEPYATTLLLARRASRGLLRHVIEATLETSKHVLVRGGYGRKACVIGAAALVGWFFFGTLPYRVTVPSTVVPARVRHLAVPYDGTLAAVVAVEGDWVRQGDLLCEFDTRDLLQQKAELSAQMAVYEREQDRARAAGSPVDARLAEANQTLVQARLEIVERRIEQASIRAPMDGLIVAGDPRRRVGEVLPRGEPLFQMAPAGSWKLEWEVPESQIDEVHSGMGGSFFSHTAPERGLPCRMIRVIPGPQIRGQKNVFVVEAEFKETSAKGDPSLRSGVQGVARIEAGRRPVCWITFHRAIDYLRLHGWL